MFYSSTYFDGNCLCDSCAEKKRKTPPQSSAATPTEQHHPTTNTSEQTTAPPAVLKLNSPAFVEPMYYEWPLQTGSGGVHDKGIEILDAIRWVCDDGRN